MTFKFNGGIGAVICDACRAIIDEGIEHAEAEEIYGEVTFCYRCTHGHEPGEVHADCRACNPPGTKRSK